MYLSADRNGASTEGHVGSNPRSHSARCAHPKPLKTTALTPCPGKVESPTQYRPGMSVELNGIETMPSGGREGMGP